MSIGPTWTAILPAGTYSGAADYYEKRILQAHENDPAADGSSATGVNLLNGSGMYVEATPFSMTLYWTNFLSGADTVGPLWANATIQNGVPLTAGWLNSTACATQVHMSADSKVCQIGRDAASSTQCDAPTGGQLCDTGWCGVKGYASAPVLPAADPAVCSNSAQFSAPAFGSVAFANATPFALFADAVVLVTPNYSMADAAVQSFEARPATTTAVTSALSGSWWSGKTGTTTLTSLDQGSMTCYAGAPVSSSNAAPYMYGNPAGTGVAGGTGTPLAVAPSVTMATSTPARALRSADTVSFELCQLHQQLMKCANGTSVCNATNCCDVGVATRDACHNFPPLAPKNGYCSRFASSSSTSPSARPWPQYFNVVRGGGADADVACVGTSDGQSCVLLGGVTDLSGDGAFAHEPNPHRDPRNLVTTGGPVLGIPIKYSLLYSADGTDPKTGSYLSQFVSGASYLQPTLAAAAYDTQAGFLALGDFGVRVTTAMTDSAAYSAFASAYFAYALVQRFLLQMYGLAALAHKGGTAYAPFALFSTKTQWASAVCGAWSMCAPASGTAGPAVNILAGLVTASDFLAGAQPVVTLAASSDEDVAVTLTVPSLLLRWPPGALLLAMFPVTAYPFVVPTTSATAYATTFTAVAGTPPAAPDSLFPLAAANSTAFATYVVGGTSTSTGTGTTTSTSSAAVPAAAAATAGSSATCLVGARVTFTVSCAAPQSVTLLFYLYCAAAGIALSPECVAETTPVTLPPALVDGSNVCDIAPACLQTGFAGVGSAAVNAVFVTATSTICKCLYPTNAVAGANTALAGGTSGSTAGAFMDTAAMCFNKYCNTDGIDLASIVATTRCSDLSQAQSQVPAAATSPDGQPFTCAGMCESYANLINASSDYDSTSVDFSALNATCDVDLTAPPVPLPRQAVFLATLVLLVLCVPLFVAAWAACAAAPKVALAQSSFLIPVIATFAVCCVAAVYAFLDLSGVPSCVGPNYDAVAGVHWPASTCKSAGLFGLVPAYTLPASLCAQRSYCMCTPSTGAGALATGTTGTCSGTCSTCSVDGRCTATSDGQVSLAHVDTTFDPLVCAFSAALAACVVPACMVAFWKCAPAFAGKAVVAALICLVLLAAAAVPVALQAFVQSFYRTTTVGYAGTATCS